MTHIVDSEGYETTYTYDKMGRLITESDNTGKAMSYAYDAVGQVKTITNALHQTTQLAYDQSGNVTKATYADGSSEKYTYDTMNRLLTMTDREGQITRYTYDARGNLTAIKGNGIDQQFTYDGVGNRLSKTVVGKITEYLNDINLPYTQVLQTYGENGNLQNTYTYGIQRIKSEGLIDEVYLYDGRGSVSGVMSDTSKLISYAYTAYGDLMPASPKPNASGYNAEDADDNTGLQYLRARYYDTNIGRFISKDAYKGDTMQPATLNRYAYCQGNPVMYADPSGYLVVRADVMATYNNYMSQVDITKPLYTAYNKAKDEYNKLSGFKNWIESELRKVEQAYYRELRSNSFSTWLFGNDISPLKDKMDALSATLVNAASLVSASIGCRESEKKKFGESGVPPLFGLKTMLVKF